MTLLLPELGFFVLALVVAWVVVRSHGADPTADERLAQQDLRRNRVIAVLAGLVTFVVFAAMPGGLGRGLMVAPLRAGAVTMCLLAAGERNVQGLLLLTLGVTLVSFSIVMFGATSQVASGAPAWVGLAHWCGGLSAVVGIGAVLVGARVGATR